jgi:hypothetical protein
LFHFVTFHFIREEEDGVTYEGNHRFEGYSMDLIDAISKILHFQYTFELVPDGKNNQKFHFKISILKSLKFHVKQLVKVNMDLIIKSPNNGMDLYVIFLIE